MSLLTEEKSVNSGKGRSPSPPVRRSVSTDRGSVIKIKVKIDTADNQPILKHPFPARVPANKPLTTTPVDASLGNNARLHWNSQEPVKQENISEALFNLQKVNSRRVHQENEEEQFKQALSAVRQGGIRKSKVECKTKSKHHQLSPFKIQKPDLIPTFTPDTEFAGQNTVETPPKSDHSESENDHKFIESAVRGALNLSQIRQSSPRNFQNLESRYG